MQHTYEGLLLAGGFTESAGEHIKLLSLEAQMTTANLKAQQTDTPVHCGHFPIWIIQSRHPSYQRNVRIMAERGLFANYRPYKRNVCLDLDSFTESHHWQRELQPAICEWCIQQSAGFCCRGTCADVIISTYTQKIICNKHKNTQQNRWWSSPTHMGKLGRRRHSWLIMKAGSARAVTSGWLTTGEGDRDMLPMEALSSSTVGAVTTRSASSGLILILNFFLWSSSPSDSSEEKNGDFLVMGSDVALRKQSSVKTFNPFAFWCFKLHPSRDIWRSEASRHELFSLLAQGSAAVNIDTLESELQNHHQNKYWNKTRHIISCEKCCVGNKAIISKGGHLSYISWWCLVHRWLIVLLFI